MARCLNAAVVVSLLNLFPRAAPGDECAYVTNTDSGAVSVINTSTNTVTATIPVASSEIAISPDGIAAYVVTGSNRVSVINTGTKTVMATIPVGDTPRGIAVSPDGARVYVANRKSDSISVIDTSERAVTATIDLPGHDSLVAEGLLIGAHAVAVSPDGFRLYVTRDYRDERIESELFSFDTRTNVEIDSTGVLSGGEEIEDIVVTPDGALVYATLEGGASDSIYYSSVAVIETATNRVERVIPIAEVEGWQGVVNVGNVAIAADGSAAYVANWSPNSLSVINTASFEVSAQIPVPVEIGPHAIAVTPDGTTAYVTNYASGTVSVIIPAANTVRHTIAVGGHPWRIAIASGPNGCSSAATTLTSSDSGGCSLTPVPSTANDLILLLVIPALLLMAWRWP